MIALVGIEGEIAAGMQVYACKGKSGERTERNILNNQKPKQPSDERQVEPKGKNGHITVETHHQNEEDEKIEGHSCHFIALKQYQGV